MFNFKKQYFLIADFLISFFTFLLIFQLRYSTSLFPNIPIQQLSSFHVINLLFYSLTIVIFNISMKLYEINKISKIKESLLNAYLASGATALIFGLFFYITKHNFARFVFFSGLSIIPLLSIISHKLLFRIIMPLTKQNVMFYIGEDANYILLTTLLEKYKDIINVKPVRLKLNELNEGTLSRCLSAKSSVIIDTNIVLSLELSLLIHKQELNGCKFYSIIDIFEYLDQSLPAELISRTHIGIFSAYQLNSFYSQKIKRVEDILISFFLIILTSPIMLITALAIKCSSKGKIFYTQKRVGLHNKEFTMYKFRTMKMDAESNQAMLTVKNDERITTIGKWIRPLRIDELPQLFNILKGEMSFIGPRPERKDFINAIIQEYPLFQKRLLVKPGLTGWAQVKYQYANSIQEMNKKLSYDLYYIKSLSFLFDLKILLYTVETVIFKRGAL